MIAPLTNEEAGAVAGQPDQCPLDKVCHGKALPWPALQGHVGIKVPANTILVVRRGLYGEVARHLCTHHTAGNVLCKGGFRSVGGGGGFRWAPAAQPPSRQATQPPSYPATQPPSHLVT